MSSVKHKYRFYVDDIRVYPVWSNGASLKFEEEGEFVFLRLKLNGTFTLVNGVRKDFTLVWAQDLDHEFTFRAEYIVDGVVEETINGTFYKTDCPLWDIDNERVDVVVQTIDRYEKLMKAFDKEFDLIGELQPPTYRVRYKKEPVIQIAFPFHTQLYQRVGNSTFLETIPAYTAAELEAFGFITSDPIRLYVPGTADMIPDVSGIYEADGTDYYERTDGIYAIRASPGPGTSWQIIEVATVDVKYTTDPTPPIGLTDPFLEKDPFVQFPRFLSTLSECTAFPIIAYQRILTDATTVGGDATLVLPVPDIGDLTFSYDNYIDQTGLVSLYVAVVPSDEHTTAETKFGRYDEDALHFADEYFNPNENPFVGVKAYPLLLQSWTEYAMVEYISGGFNDELVEATTTVALRDAYKLSDVLIKLFANIDTEIAFEETAFNSKFLYDTTNPVTLEAQALNHFITPKSNILLPDYSQPDTKELITFGSVDRLLRAAQLFWWIDNVGNFRIEHISYFKNGRSYDFGTPFVGVNLTTLSEPRTGKFWGYHTNKYRYTKEKMPEQLTSSWQDDSSEYFKGSPIDIISGFVEKGFIQELKVEKFSSDISLAVAFPDNFSGDGFFIMAAEFSGGNWDVPYEVFSVGTFTNILVQNGWWSFYHLHENFWRHNLPAEDIKINGTVTTATTTKRGKEQSLVFPSGVNPDPTRLITSGIGNCEIAEMEINLATRKCTIKALGDLDFDNPCPTC